MPAELDEYRAEADRFLTALQEEYYLQLSGQKPDLVVEPIYDRYSDLTSPASCRELGELARASGTGGGLRDLWRFACEGRIGHLTAAEQERIAELEATLEAEVDGRRIGYRELRPSQANEPDRAAERAARRRPRRAARGAEPPPRRGSRSPARRRARAGRHDLRRPLRGIRLRAGAARGPGPSAFSRIPRTSMRARSTVCCAAASGSASTTARRWDIPRLFRSDAWDDAYPGRPHAARARRDARRPRDRPQGPAQRRARRRAAAREGPAGLLLPDPGAGTRRALHQADGRRRRLAGAVPRGRSSRSTSPIPRPGCPWRRDVSATTPSAEGWAFLLERLVTDPAWLARQLDVPRPDGLAEESAAVLLYMVRRYCGKLLYELELHARRRPRDAAGPLRRRSWARQPASSRRPPTSSSTSTPAST